MFITKLKKMPYAQAHIEHYDECDYLVSYTTIVAYIDEKYAYCNGTYSQTTRKHIGAFASEYGLNYQIFKKCYEENKKYNLKTQEFEDLITEADIKAVEKYNFDK